MLLRYPIELGFDVWKGDDCTSYFITNRGPRLSCLVLQTGPPSAISDITEVAGWVVLNCTSDNTTQDLRLVCASGTDDCDHLYLGGAEGTIVRLPSNVRIPEPLPERLFLSIYPCFDQCGKGPFARVAKSWVSEDQGIPDHVARRLVKRDGVLPQVQALSLDPHFHKVDVQK